MQPQYSQSGGQFSMPPQATASSHMKKKHGWLIPFIIAGLLAFLFAGLFAWAFVGRQDYKNNVDAKVSQAVQIAVSQESDRKDNEFLEKEKSPFKSYKGSDTFGGLSFNYPKTWSAYVEETGKGSTPLDAYFHPNIVPNLSSGSVFALRVKIVDKAYAEHLKSFESKVSSGKVKLSAYTPVNQPKITGTYAQGEISTGQQNYMILLPLRDKTIEISTEAQQYKGDFETVIKTVNFTP